MSVNDPIRVPRMPSAASYAVRAVSIAFEQSEEDILGHRRFQVFARPRLAAYRILRDHGKSLNEISMAMNGRDHATVMSGLRRVKHLLRTDDEFAECFAVSQALFNSAISKLTARRQEYMRLAENGIFDFPVHV